MAIIMDISSILMDIIRFPDQSSARSLKAFSARLFRESTVQETLSFDRILSADAIHFSMGISGS